MEVNPFSEWMKLLIKTCGFCEWALISGEGSWGPLEQRQERRGVLTECGFGMQGLPSTSEVSQERFNPYLLNPGNCFVGLLTSERLKFTSKHHLSIEKLMDGFRNEERQAVTSKTAGYSWRNPQPTNRGSLSFCSYGGSVLCLLGREPKGIWRTKSWKCEWFSLKPSMDRVQKLCQCQIIAAWERKPSQGWWWRINKNQSSENSRRIGRMAVFQEPTAQAPRPEFIFLVPTWRLVVELCTPAF